MSALLDESLRSLGDCGCCADVGAGVPGVVHNRPGLSALAYRSATWHEFRRSLLTALSDRDRPQLRGLGTRNPDDFTIALLDAVASMGDVLTFYGERIANESYLRTANERRSVLELARLIGYELKPGVAASTLLAFNVENPPGAVEPSLAPPVAVVEAGVKVQSVPGHEEKPQTFETVERIEAHVAWNAMTVRPAAPNPGLQPSEIWLAGTNSGLATGDPLLLLDAGPVGTMGDEIWNVRQVRAVTTHPDTDRTQVALAAWPGAPSPAGSSAAEPAVYALRARAPLFGHSAPDWKALSKEFKGSYMNELPGSEAVKNQADWPGFSDILIPAGTSASTTSAKVDLDGAHPGVMPDSWAVLATPEKVQLYRITSAVTTGRAEFALSGKVTRVTLTGPNLVDYKTQVRTAILFGQEEPLTLACSPLAPPVTGMPSTLLVEGDVGDLPNGRALVLAGVDAVSGEAASEAVSVDHVTDEGSASRIHLATTLEHSYLADSLVIHANVAHATHGETVTEVLGAGNAARRFQQFTLKQPPLTHVRNPATSSGAASTLEVWVNELRWEEVPSFHGRGPSEHIFVTRRDDEGRTVVQFGDGVHGARLPTGQENVRAEYRKGVGVGANVRAGQLSTLLTKPLGIKDARNPAPATGGDEPEPRDAARDNAPLSVLTLGRVVSLRDYEDFARGYAGIAKALATWSWDGERRGVFVTVAGPTGAPVPDDVLDLLLGAIRASGDPFVPLRVASYRKATFTTAFHLRTDPAREKAVVHDAAVAALRTAFDFRSRSFGQAVPLSDVIATVAAVAGVIGVDVDALDRTDGEGGSGLLEPLPAAMPGAGALAATEAAELLTLADAPITPGDLA